MHGQTHFLQENSIQHQMTHVEDYSTGVRDINFHSILQHQMTHAWINSIFLTSLQHQMTYVKNYSIGDGDIGWFPLRK